MVQVISNLINNAVHYTEKGKITVGAKREGDSTLFSVSDTGQGIPKEFHGKIFQRFYQVDSPLTRKIGGTGLGLSLSKGFVEAMNGKIWFESDEGKGAVFYFSIPIESAKQTAQEVDLFKQIHEQGYRPIDQIRVEQAAKEILLAMQKEEQDKKIEASREEVKGKPDQPTIPSKPAERMSKESIENSTPMQPITEKNGKSAESLIPGQAHAVDISERAIEKLKKGGFIVPEESSTEKQAPSKETFFG